MSVSPGGVAESTIKGDRRSPLTASPGTPSDPVRPGAYPVSRWDAGASPVYAIGTIAAAAFAAVLYKVVTGGAILDALEALVQRLERVGATNRSLPRGALPSRKVRATDRLVEIRSGVVHGSSLLRLSRQRGYESPCR